MTRSLAGPKSIVSSLADKLSVSFASRRGFAASPSGGVSAAGGGMSTGGMMRKMNEAAGGTTARESSWAPDPLTGYYRPADRDVEIDPAELRAMLLKPKANN